MYIIIIIITSTFGKKEFSDHMQGTQTTLLSVIIITTISIMHFVTLWFPQLTLVCATAEQPRSYKIKQHNSDMLSKPGEQNGQRQLSEYSRTLLIISHLHHMLSQI